MSEHGMRILFAGVAIEAVVYMHLRTWIALHLVQKRLEQRMRGEPEGGVRG